MQLMILTDLPTKRFVIDAKILRGLTKWIESLIVQNIGLKKQIDILKDIVVQLPEVKGNPAIMADIEKAFRDYNRSNI
jgi:hypothetical protein